MRRRVGHEDAQRWLRRQLARSAFGRDPPDEPSAEGQCAAVRGVNQQFPREAGDTGIVDGQADPKWISAVLARDVDTRDRTLKQGAEQAFPEVPRTNGIGRAVFHPSQCPIDLLFGERGSERAFRDAIVRTRDAHRARGVGLFGPPDPISRSRDSGGPFGCVVVTRPNRRGRVT